MSRKKNNLSREHRKQQKSERKRRHRLIARRDHANRAKAEANQFYGLSNRLQDYLDKAYWLIDEEDFESAESLLHELDEQYRGCYEVVRARSHLYQQMGDHARWYAAADRMKQLRSNEPDVNAFWISAAMSCGYATVAYAAIKEFQQRWPNHAFNSNAKKYLVVLEDEVQSRITKAGFPPDSAIRLQILHEISMSRLQNGEFDATVETCQRLMEEAPGFLPARNNLALAYFHNGQLKQAVSVAEQTQLHTAKNDFSKVLLAKLRFMAGQEIEANQLIHELMAEPPTDQDPLIAMYELLALVGRDNDMIQLEKLTRELLLPQSRSKALQLHFLAFAKYRMGEIRAAKARWQECLKIDKHLNVAQANLDALESEEDFTPWPFAIHQWTSKDEISSISKRVQAGERITDDPRIKTLITALLDRGDHQGRNFALLMIKSDPSPFSIQAAHAFAFGQRGPKSSRLEALLFLRQQGILDAGPHRIYSNGKYDDILLRNTEIYDEPKEVSYSGRVQELIEQGCDATRRSQYDQAEAFFRQALEEDPECCPAAFNLYRTWLIRDGKAGFQRARPAIEELCRKNPDYLFAKISLAQFLADEGQTNEARILLDEVHCLPRMHRSEAKALYMTQILIDLLDNKLKEAKMSFRALANLFDSDDPDLAILQQEIDSASNGSSWFKRNCTIS